ncbi:MAG: galactokinase [Spirochaetia bacterium]|nr:galactokinase family protein [uncultured Treponema sp.]MCI7397105.1 galactokinase [Spirochaetia bacterium]MCI7577716.1 galactokinase [Spirochaetia bacterium]
MDKVIAEHKKEYGVKPSVISQAPGRFHLCGEHSWMFRDKTLSMAVNLPVYVAGSLRDDTSFRFNFVQLEEKKHANLSSLKLKKEDKWANSVKSVLYGFASGNFDLKGIDFTIYTDILPSAGFGITTAIKVASAWVIKELCGIKCPQDQMLKVLERANRNYYGTDNHMADTYAALFSKEDSLVLTDYSEKSWDLIPFKMKDRKVILTDASVPRIVTWNEDSLMQPENVLLLGELKNLRSNVYGGWQYEESQTEINEVLGVVNEDTKRRLNCIMKEHKCVLDCIVGLQKNDFACFARSVNRSHDNMRDYEISCPEIDWIIKRIRNLDEKPDDLRTPVNCGRITGKGFGRGIYSVLRDEDVAKYKEKLEEYERIFGFEARCYEVEPAKGVHLL